MSAGAQGGSFARLDYRFNRLPVTAKQHLREGYPFEFLTIGKDEVVRLHSSSGTTGQATVVCHNAPDLAAWANLIARCMYMFGRGTLFGTYPQTLGRGAWGQR